MISIHKERGYQSEWPSQKAVHTRIHNYRGSAKNQKCIDCGEQAQDWSWEHGTEYRDIWNYDPRCRRCHLKYDHYTRVCISGCTCKRHDNKPVAAAYTARWPKREDKLDA
jgi:NAD-dependent SIR2 family protein deacetylase